jgi:hypothetical protein
MGKLLTCLPDSRLHNCERFGQLQNVRATETLKTSHRPDGILTCFALVLSGRRCFHPWWHGDFVIMHHHWQHSYISACSRSKIPFAPKVRLLTCLPRLTLAQLRPMLWSTTGGACRRDLKFPIAPMGNSRFARCLQGGGVAVFGGTVTISSCTISGNTADYVHTHPQKFPMPRS